MVTQDTTLWAKWLYTYTITASSLTSFGVLPKPYTQPEAQIVTITNVGTGSVTLTQPVSTHYVIGILSATTLASTGATATFTVQPKAGLPAGIYNEAIPIKGSNGATATVYASFKVECPPKMEDLTNNISYDVVELAGQCWCTENLRSTLYQDGTEIPFANPYYNPLYPDSEQYTIDFGLLYDYESVSSGKLCPAGWRLPTSAEWLLLNMYNLTELSDPAYWLTPNTHTNSKGFNLRAAGFFNADLQRYENLYGFVAYWSSEISTSTALIPVACKTHYCPYIELKEIKKTDAVSVRCVMK